MNDIHQFQMLMRKELPIVEGIDLIEQIERELAQAKHSADAWGVTAVIARLVMIPANVVVNAGQVSAAKTALQALGHAVAEIAYKRHGASGNGVEGFAKPALATLKRVVVAELKTKGLAHYVPGANIIIGLSEDSLALLSAMRTVTDGSAEIRAISQKQQALLARMRRELVALGIQANQHLGRIQMVGRTA